MKTIQKKMLVQVLLGFLLGRVSIYGMNPVAPAFFAAGFAEGGAVLPVAITILLGMSTVFALDTVLAYGAGMLALWLAADFLKRRRITVKMGHAAFCWQRQHGSCREQGICLFRIVEQVFFGNA